jgi:hypothetical protein
MKIFIKLLMIISVLIIAGMQNAQAQKTVIVPWTEGDCDCPFPGQITYRVDIEVIDQCGEDDYTIYADHQFLSQSPATFILEKFCDDTSNEDCYLLVAAVSKYCSDGHGGYIEVCNGKFEGYHYTCAQLMSSGTITIPLITIN